MPLDRTKKEVIWINASFIFEEPKKEISSIGGQKECYFLLGNLLMHTVGLVLATSRHHPSLGGGGSAIWL